MLRMSAVFITLEEAGRIGAAVRAVRPFVDEVLVLDGGSRDETVAEARAAGARVELHPFDGFVRQKQRATEAATHDLIVSVDADEQIDAELGAALRSLRERPERPSDGMAPVGFWVRRQNYLDRRAIGGTGWYPDRRIRVFDRRRARWTGHEPHDRVELSGPCGSLPGHLHHDVERTTSDYVRATVAHARRRACSLVEDGARVGPIAPWLHAAAHLLRKLAARPWRDRAAGWTILWVGTLGVLRKYRLARRLRRGQGAGA